MATRTNCPCHETTTRFGLSTCSCGFHLSLYWDHPGFSNGCDPPSSYRRSTPMGCLSRIRAQKNPCSSSSNSPLAGTERTIRGVDAQVWDAHAGLNGWRECESAFTSEIWGSKWYLFFRALLFFLVYTQKHIKGDDIPMYQLCGFISPPYFYL